MTYQSILTMRTKTFNRLYNKLLREISIHPFRDEILNLMYQQVQDEVDTTTKLSKCT